jgi:ubiquinone/menaquinone biosynthesis C-methylase UbiE
MEAKQFWNKVGSTKEFADPFDFERFLPGLNPASIIVEYGCGYGRILNQLHLKGFSHCIGFDFASNMIQRGKNAFHFLDLRLLDEPLKIPLPDQSVDGLILSTVLTCIPDPAELQSLVSEVFRVLKPGGRLYVADFLLTTNAKYGPLYERDKTQFQCYGTFLTTEGGVVRHFEKAFMLSLLQPFQMEWYEERDFVTMNLNPIRTFHFTGIKAISTPENSN